MLCGKCFEETQQGAELEERGGYGQGSGWERKPWLWVRTVCFIPNLISIWCSGLTWFALKFLQFLFEKFCSYDVARGMKHTFFFFLEKKRLTFSKFVKERQSFLFAFVFSYFSLHMVSVALSCLFLIRRIE